MQHDPIARDLYQEICKIPLIDPHSHINPHHPTAKNLDEILGYHYYTELAHSAGMSQDPLQSNVEPKERCRALLRHLDRLDNTAQYSWFLEIAQTFLDFKKDHVGEADCDWLWEQAETKMAQHDWELQVLEKSNLEKVFLTNEFDDPLTGFDQERYVPCLRTDDLVFHLGTTKIQDRLKQATDVDVDSVAELRRALSKLFDHFVKNGARACAISLPPDFEPMQPSGREFESSLEAFLNGKASADQKRVASNGIFWTLAEQCRERSLPFDLMIGVIRKVYRNGVFQGQDLFDQRTSLYQYADLFNAFPEVPFCISVLTSSQNQELASYSWIFPNVITSGHWWYSNVPVYLERDTRARLQAVPKTKQIGYYSDMYKLEFGLPKFNMYRRVLAKLLAEDYIRGASWSEEKALSLARIVLRDNVKSIFKI